MVWNPWESVSNRDDLVVEIDDVPSRGTWHRDAAGDVITLDRRLNGRERRAVLAHELIHSERSIGFPDASAATMEREEAMVRREVARRLVPTAELLALTRSPEGVPVTVDLIAEKFDVPVDVAREALQRAR